MSMSDENPQMAEIPRVPNSDLFVKSPRQKSRMNKKRVFTSLDVSSPARLPIEENRPKT